MSKKKKKKNKIKLGEALSNIERQEKDNSIKTLEKSTTSNEHGSKAPINSETNLIKKDMRRILLATLVTVLLLAIVVYLGTTTNIIDDFSQRLADSLHIEI